MSHDNAFERGDHQYIYRPIEPAKYTGTRCAGEVRWSEGGKLQQRFVITDFVGGSAIGERDDWRDVPAVGTNDHSKGAM